jgi:four helix bundle protein
MTKIQETRYKKVFDLEERTLIFSRNLIKLLKKIQKEEINRELLNQVIRSGTSVGANYREANDALGEKDFYMRIKICRKESKETTYWLDLILFNNSNLSNELNVLKQESEELTKIFSAIISKGYKKNWNNLESLVS